MSKIELGDCRKLFKDIPDNSVDLIATSPPYDNIEGAGYQVAQKDILFLSMYSEFLDEVFDNMYRVLKPTGQIFFNIKSGTSKKNLITPHWIEFLESFKQFKLKSYIIWKYSGSFDSTKVRFHLDYEIIYHLSKTDDITIYHDHDEHDPVTSIWTIPHYIQKKDRKHPTQFPKALVERMIKRGSKEGDLVLDPFAGSGPTLAVAKKLGRQYIGFEINPHHFKTIQERLALY